MRISRLAFLLLALLLPLTLCACGIKKTEDKTVVILETTPTPTNAAAPGKTEDADLLSASDWYGWWKMDHCSGDWAKMYGYYWDCCAEISEADDGGLTLLLWDEDLPKDDCLARAILEKKDGGLRCVGGSFLDRELGAADWDLTLREDACGALLTVEGEYKAVGKGGFHYVIYLRPWGSRWPGSKDEQPYYYETWYLPLIEAGEPMPDTIGK